MYIPKHFDESSIPVMHALIKAHPLGTWVAQSGTELVANHIPFILDPAQGQFGTLTGHVARANPVWKLFPSTLSSLIIFQGPESYITPSWYATKQEHGKVVPTWNYAVVHASGFPQIHEDPLWLLEHVTQLTQIHEESEPTPWMVADAPKDFINQLLQAIVGIEIPLDKLTGKWKASQNRSDADKQGVMKGLMTSTDPDSQAMGRIIRDQQDREA